jgi:hypothetical protein
MIAALDIGRAAHAGAQSSTGRNLSGSSYT